VNLGKEEDGEDEGDEGEDDEEDEEDDGKSKGDEAGEGMTRAEKAKRIKRRKTESRRVLKGRELTWGCIAKFWRETLISVVCIRQQANQLVSLIKLPRKKVSYHGTPPPPG
jgi:hypothetical protein